MTTKGTSIDLTVNLTKVQFVLALMAHALAILGVAITLALWVGRILIAQEFQLQLEVFHSHAKPAIEEMVDAKILALAKEREMATASVREDVSIRLSTLEEHARNTDNQLDRIEDKLDRALR
jgi:hypothetical protein